MDTSDGLYAALTTLAEMNQCGYAVEKLPISEIAGGWMDGAGLPRVLLALAGSGEYELLWTVDPRSELAMVESASASGLGVMRIGVLTPAGRILNHGQGQLTLTDFQLEARDFESPAEYLRALIGWLEAHSKTPPTQRCL
jgi:thiamine monophosphate kinase